MIEKLVKKVVEDAEKKAVSIIKSAEKELEERYLLGKREIDREYEMKLTATMAEIDRDGERSLSNFRLEKEKSLLAIQNEFIAETMKAVEKRFNEYLNGHMKEIIVSICGEITERDFIVKIPASKGPMNIKDIKIEEDEGLVNAFVIEAEKWRILFGWERIKAVIEDDLKEKIGSFLEK